MKILDGLGAVELRRRIILIHRLVKQAERIPEGQLVAWFVKRRCAVNRAIEDLLEPTLYVACHVYVDVLLFNNDPRNSYPVEYNLIAANQSAALKTRLYLIVNLPGQTYIKPLSTKVTLSLDLIPVLWIT